MSKFGKLSLNSLQSTFEDKIGLRMFVFCLKRDIASIYFASAWDRDDFSTALTLA